MFEIIGSGKNSLQCGKKNLRSLFSFYKRNMEDPLHMTYHTSNNTKFVFVLILILHSKDYFSFDGIKGFVLFYTLMLIFSLKFSLTIKVEAPSTKKLYTNQLNWHQYKQIITK